MTKDWLLETWKAMQEVQFEAERMRLLAKAQHGHDFNTDSRVCRCGLDSREYHLTKPSERTICGRKSRRPDQ